MTPASVHGRQDYSRVAEAVRQKVHFSFRWFGR
jgi:hypothetical protein